MATFGRRDRITRAAADPEPADDASVVAARAMGARIAALTDALEDAALGPLDDEGFFDPGTGTTPDEDGLYDDERGGIDEEIVDDAVPLEGEQWT